MGDYSLLKFRILGRTSRLKDVQFREKIREKHCVFPQNLQSIIGIVAHPLDEDTKCLQ